jgi:hypothetical protein
MLNGNLFHNVQGFDKGHLYLNIYFLKIGANQTYQRHVRWLVLA